MALDTQKAVTGAGLANKGDEDLTPRKLVYTFTVFFIALFIYVLDSIKAWSVFLDHFSAIIIFQYFVMLCLLMYGVSVFITIVMIVRLIPTEKKNRILKLIEIVSLVFLGIDVLGYLLPSYPLAITTIACLLWVIMLPNLMDRNLALPLSLVFCVFMTSAVYGIAYLI